jgi:germination protein M
MERPMKKWYLLLLIIVSFAGLASCNKKEPTPQSSTPGRVIATSAYEKYFGAAPSVDKGTAYAFVIFFPSSTPPGKVVPFPFFTFDEVSLKKVSIERLLGGMDIGSYQGEFIPFPSGVRLISVNDDQGTVTVNFSSEVVKSTNDATIRAVALTLRQFKGVKDVRIQVEGKEAPLSSLAKNDNESDVLQPSPPRLLSVTAMRDKGAKNIEDVNAFFDRPVNFLELKLLSKEGQPFAGELYYSVFDMAAVLKPKDTSQFKERMPIRVHWKVVDKLGRQAEGDNIWALEVRQHEQ